MNIEQQQIIDEAYENYLKNGQQQADINKENQTFLPLPKNWFIDKCKTNLEFSEKWGLRIEERELSLDDRNQWFHINWNGRNPSMKSNWNDYELNQQNVPTKLITLTHNNETIESYE